MALRDKLRERVQPSLEPGEQIQAVFLAQSGPNPALFFLSYLIMFWTKFWVFAVTDKRIVLLRSSPMAPSKPKELVKSFPRDTPLPDPGGKIWTEVPLDGTRYWVHRRFWSDLREAKTAAATPPAVAAPAPPAAT